MATASDSGSLFEAGLPWALPAGPASSHSHLTSSPGPRTRTQMGLEEGDFSWDTGGISPPLTQAESAHTLGPQWAGPQPCP